MSDIITMQVIQNSLVSICNEMGIIMMRSAYSPLFNEIHDFSCAILDKDGLLIAEGLHLLQHTGSLEYTTIHVLKYLEEQGLGIHPGDIIFSNHTYIGGTHLPEINVYTPLFYEDEFVFLPAVRAHHVDVGGTVPGRYIYACYRDVSGRTPYPTCKGV